MKIDPRIEEILLSDWDPAGVKDLKGAKKEYSSYALQVFSMLYRNATENEISNYLKKVTEENFELIPDIKKIESTAKKLCALNLQE